MSDLPDGIVAGDLKYPVGKLANDVGDYGRLTFYKVDTFGWCIATLGIRRARRAGRTDRTYAAKCSDGGLCRIGNGPHVRTTITVYIKQSRVKALQKYIDMYNKGSVDANVVRDRISSRRAEGALRRSRGERSWWRGN